MKKTFKAYADPGHAWVCVPRSLLVELGVLGKISSCSYQRGTNVYLEEDCDLYEFHKAYEERNGTKPVYKSNHTNNQSKIRNYESFNVNSLPIEGDDILPGMDISIYGKQYKTVSKTSSGWRVLSTCGAIYNAKNYQIEYP